MPPVRSVTITPDSVTLVTVKGTRTLLASDIPQNQNTAAKAETWANTWLAANVLDCQVRVHVFSLSPLSWTCGTWNLGLPIPDGWWLDG